MENLYIKLYIKIYIKISSKRLTYCIKRFVQNITKKKKIVSTQNFRLNSDSSRAFKLIFRDNFIQRLGDNRFLLQFISHSSRVFSHSSSVRAGQGRAGGIRDFEGENSARAGSSILSLENYSARDTFNRPRFSARRVANHVVGVAVNTDEGCLNVYIHDKILVCVPKRIKYSCR